MTGTVALNMHAFKATSRLAINTSPEPFSNIAASTAENSAVFFMYWLFIKHPVWASLLMIAILVLAFFMIRLLWRFAKKVFGAIFHVMKPAEVRAASQPQPSTK